MWVALILLKALWIRTVVHQKEQANKFDYNEESENARREWVKKVYVHDEYKNTGQVHQHYPYCTDRIGKVIEQLVHEINVRILHLHGDLIAEHCLEQGNGHQDQFKHDDDKDDQANNVHRVGTNETPELIGHSRIVWLFVSKI